MIKIDYDSKWYQDFLNNNPGKGMLKIRAYAASEALPVVGLKVIVSSMLDKQEVVFYEGETDASGMIQNITLPAPKLDSSNLVVPITVVYKLNVYYKDNSFVKDFYINMYDGVCVVQNINVVFGDNYGN